MNESKLLLHFNKSIIVSPLSLRLPLCKLASVAQGDVKVELLQFLEYKNINMVINMKLASPGVSMTFVIPEDRKSLQDFLRNLLRPNYFRTIKKRMRMEFLNIAIPRFKLKTLVDWTDSLQKVGLKKLFDINSTGLNNMLINEATDKPLHISKVKQKNFIEVNEMGAYRIITTECKLHFTLSIERTM
ncbi:serine protease inhibitor 3/4-like [Pieris rapae]|uniref:serine protease inhibitor 3/4-like n=1 Tax=Pieris rapae TaxID=64459 RepID=UPI001E27B344|nr:serine protease inhibitor 3/4-like [Pieris rapae]